MSTVTVSTAAKIAALDAILDQVDIGVVGDATGDFQVLTAGAASLGIMNFANPAFAAAANVGGTIKAAANTITAGANPTAGTIGLGKFRDRANAAVITFDIDTSGSPGMTVADKVIPGGATSISVSGLEVSLDIVGA